MTNIITSLRIICSYILITHPWIVHPDDGRGLRLLEMSVPSLADPRDPLTLTCKYDMGGEELNSVKWYKDEEEFFRYMPLQKPSILIFPVAGVHLKHDFSHQHQYGGGSVGYDTTSYRSECTEEQCTITLVNLTRVHSSGAYKCEISSEAPTFRVVFATTNVTVAAVPKERPSVTGLKSVYTPGEVINVTCTSSPSEPPSTITFLINGKPPPASSIFSGVSILAQDKDGLVSSTASLRLIADRLYFIGSSAVMEVRCVAAIPAVPQIPPQHTALTTTLKTSHSFLTNQKLEWSKNTGPRKLQMFDATNLAVMIITVTYMLSSILFLQNYNY